MTNCANTFDMKYINDIFDIDHVYSVIMPHYDPENQFILNFFFSCDHHGNYNIYKMKNSYTVFTLKSNVFHENNDFISTSKS